MLLLLVVALVAGLVTVFSPCILPVLPVVLGSSVGGGKRRPLGVIAGLIISFSIFTLAISQILAKATTTRPRRCFSSCSKSPARRSLRP